jgi:hypothetical protein
MTTDFSKPAVTDAYATLLPGVSVALQDLARGLDPVLTGTHTNIPTGTLRWNAASAMWERYNGTSWAAAAATYAISISGNAATATTAASASAVAWAGVTGKPTTVAGYGITDAITTGNIGAQVVASAAALTGSTTWSLPYQSAPGVTSYLSPGTAGQVLTSQGAAAPVWANPPAQIQPVTASVASNALTVSLAATRLDFRSTTLGNGAVTSLAVPALNLTVPSGATLGTINAVQSKIMVLCLNNAGTPELAVVNIAGGTNLTATGLISTTAISAGSTSASVVYSTTARTNVAYRVVGYVESTQATAGTWATAPSTVQGMGDEIAGALASIGYGQTPQDVTGSRVAGTTYYNTTGKPITVCITTTNSSTAASTMSVNGVAYANVGHNSVNQSIVFSSTFVIPVSASYAFSAGATIVQWSELR